MQEILLSYLLILDIDSDTEEYPEQLHIEDTLFEPAGQLEIEDNGSDDETVAPKISRDDNDIFKGNSNNTNFQFI